MRPSHSAVKDLPASCSGTPFISSRQLL